MGEREKSKEFTRKSQRCPGDITSSPDGGKGVVRVILDAVLAPLSVMAG
jgi:hypothetical protein